jgi:hypothetical protein
LYNKRKLREFEEEKQKELFLMHGNKKRRDACERKISSWQEGKPRGRDELGNIFATASITGW